MRTHQESVPTADAGPGSIVLELSSGLTHPQAHIAPKFFYDRLGSKLFEAICDLDEYYLTRAETALFEAHAAAVGALAGTGATLIDLGAGNCAKAASLFPALRPRQYVAVDISADFLQDAVSQMRGRFPDIVMTALGLDFSEALELPAEVLVENRLFFYPGSSLGNFAPLQAGQLLGRIRNACGANGGLLIGIDLVKAPELLEAAYDDALGVTAAFNLNALRHVNRLLGSDFDPCDWRHVALFNAKQSRVEMHLQARRDVAVHWPGGRRQFASGDRIHTENSYKFTRQQFEALLTQSGFGQITCWTAPGDAYLLCHARAV